MTMKSSDNAADAAHNGDRSLEQFFDVLHKRYPAYTAHIDTASKGVSTLKQAADTLEPYIWYLWVLIDRACHEAARYQLDEYLPMIVGLVICFFGSYFTMLIAVTETVRVLCWERLRDSFRVLRQNYEVAMEQNRKDNTVDADGNGIADVEEISSRELFSRKLFVFLKAVDLHEVQTATQTMCGAFLSVIATLRVKLARSFTLGISFSTMAKDYFSLEAVLNEVLPADLRKFSEMIATYVLNFLGVLLAVAFSPILSCVHCAIRGAHVFVRSAIHIGRKKGLLEDDQTIQSAKAKALLVVVATMGISWQLAHHQSAMPMLLRIGLIPFSLLEGLLQILVTFFLTVVPTSGFI